jgi:hypothetical protein
LDGEGSCRYLRHDFADWLRRHFADFFSRHRQASKTIFGIAGESLNGNRCSNPFSYNKPDVFPD